jgi:cell division protein FtsB
LNRAANTYWVDERLATQRPMPRKMAFSLVREAIIGHTKRATRTAHLDGLDRIEESRREAIIPSWTIFYMIILAMAAICFTVTMRTSARMTSAIEQHGKISASVETLRSTNASLQQEIDQLYKDPHTIETAARDRLGMVRPNEIVVPD